METFLQYQNRINEELYEMKNKKFFVFGVTSVGQMAKLVLEHAHAEMIGFCDNAAKKQGTIYRGKMIYKPEDAVKIEKNAVFIICSFVEKNVQMIKNQLREYGVNESDIWDKDAFLLYFHSIYTKRQVKKGIYLQMLYKHRYHIGLELPNISLIVTDYCNLKCKNCMRMVNKIKMREQADINVLDRAMHQLSSAVDVICSYDFLGGEPFLYSDIEKAMEKIVGCDNVQMIDVVTNGSIFPKNSILENIKKYGIRIMISDYGFYPDKVEKLKNVLEEMELIYEVYDERQSWHPISYIGKKEFTKNELSKKYHNCTKERNCHEIWGMMLSPCGFYTSMSKEGKLGEECLADGIDLEMDPQKIREKIEKWQEDDFVINVCAYCNFDLDVCVERGEQENGN